MTLSPAQEHFLKRFQLDQQDEVREALAALLEEQREEVFGEALNAINAKAEELEAAHSDDLRSIGKRIRGLNDAHNEVEALRSLSGGGKEECPNCKGQRVVPMFWPSGALRVGKCPTCEGTGQVAPPQPTGTESEEEG